MGGHWSSRVQAHPVLPFSVKESTGPGGGHRTADYHGAVTLLAGPVPSLVCLDLTLPRESGFELCEHIRSDPRLRFVPILVMSERSSPEDMAHAENVGANAFLKKPFTREKLLKYVITLLDGPHASRPSVRRLRRSEIP